MFEKLIELIITAWDDCKFFGILNPYEGGVVLRLGKLSRLAKSGVVWKIPFLEKILYTNVAITTLTLPSQTITTKDHVSLVISSVVKYEIEHPEKFLLEIWDAQDVLKDVVLGYIQKEVAKLNYLEIIDSNLETKIKNKVRKDVTDYGFRIHLVTFTNLGKVKSLRLIQDQNLE